MVTKEGDAPPPRLGGLVDHARHRARGPIDRSHMKRLWIPYKKAFGLKLSGNEVYYAACSLLIILQNWSRQLHCKKVLSKQPFLIRWLPKRAMRPPHVLGVLSTMPVTAPAAQYTLSNRPTAPCKEVLNKPLRNHEQSMKHSTGRPPPETSSREALNNLLA